MAALAASPPSSTANRRPTLDELTELVAPRTRESDQCEALATFVTLPEGGTPLVEGHHKLILRSLYAPGRVETIALLPKGNGKTLIFGVAMDHHLLTENNPQGFICAADVAQAQEMYRFISHFASCDEELEELLSPKPGTNRIVALDEGGREKGACKILSSDNSKAAGRKQSISPTLYLVDEYHAHANTALYTAGRSAMFKRNGRMGVLSTAGHDRESGLGQLRSRMLAIESEGGFVFHDLHVTDDGRLSDDGPGRLNVAISASGNTVLLEWACHGEDHPDGPDDLDDPHIVKLANPASYVTVKGIQDGRESLTPWEFARYRANVWTLGHQSWLPAGAWGALGDDGPGLDPNGGPIALHIDMGRYSDSAALIGVQQNPDGAWLMEPLLILRSGGPDKPVPYEPVVAAIVKAWKELPVSAVGFDDKYFDQAATELQNKHQVNMVKVSQGNESIGPAFYALRRALLAETAALRWRRDAQYADEFGRQVVAGELKELGEKSFKLIKPSRHALIDAAVSLAFAYSLAVIVKPAYTGPLFERL